jgi:hypothetical protein
MEAVSFRVMRAESAATYFVVWIGRSELPTHDLLVLLRRNDSDEGADDRKKVFERRVFLLTTAARGAVRLRNHGPGRISLVVLRERNLMLLATLVRTDLHATSK